MIWCTPMSCTWEFVIKACVVIAGFSRAISSKAFPLSEHVSLSSGHSLSGLYKNSGPFHHLFSATNSLAVIPRDGLSAGFWLPGQNFHNIWSCVFSNFLHPVHNVLVPRFDILYPTQHSHGIDPVLGFQFLG